MEREIKKIVNKIVSEEFSGRIFKVKKQLLENEGETCECGGMMYEGECMECGNMYEGDIQELGGMDDGHPRFGKKRFKTPMSIEDIEKLLRGDEEEEEEEYHMMGHHDDEHEEEESEWEEIGEEECVECGDMYEDEVEEGNEFSGELAKAREDGKKTFTVDGKTYPVKESKVYFTESEMIDIIENIVKEEKKKSKAPSAQNILKSSLGKSKKENDDYIKSVTKKMKDYLKDASKGDFEPNPTNFPEGNYDLDNRKEKLKKYTPSEAVDEYIDAFSYPGMTNLVYDEIKPNDERIEKYLKGDKLTGNAEVGEDGKALGNVVPSKVGEKFVKNYKDNLYGQEQMTASYKRQTQPVDQAGEETEKGGLKDKKGKKSAQSVLNAIEESVENKKVISDMEKIKNLIDYSRKTQ